MTPMAFRPAMPHGPITEVFDDVFMVTGGFRFAPGLSISRNMTIVRENGELTLINSVRLTDEGEQELDKLGKVKNLVRIGFFHGADDPYYLDRYKPSLWAPKGIEHARGVKPEQELTPWSTPIGGAKVFMFERGKDTEALFILDRNGGVMVSCDSFQNWTSFAECSFLGSLMMRSMRFGPTMIGPMWIKRMGREVKADFDRLADHSFKHLVPGHGTVLKNQAADGLRTAVKKSFG
jgi:hypothetical protein